MVRVIRLEDDRRPAAQVSVRGDYKAARSARRNNYLERAAGRLDADAIMKPDLVCDRPTKLIDALEEAVMVQPRRHYLVERAGELRLYGHFVLALHKVPARRDEAGDSANVRLRPLCCLQYVTSSDSTAHRQSKSAKTNSRWYGHLLKPVKAD
jgi:hypothetical protein